MGQERFVSKFCVLKLQRSQGAEFPQTAAAFIVRYCPEGRGSWLERTESAGLSGAAHGTPLFFGRHSAGSGGLVVFSAVFPAPASDVCQCARRAARHFDRGFPAGVRADAEKPAGAHPVVL